MESGDDVRGSQTGIEYDVKCQIQKDKFFHNPIDSKIEI